MRAVVATAFGGPEVLEVCQMPELAAGSGQVVVDVGVAPVLFVDTQIRAGLARDWLPSTPPYVPGAGVAGTVASVGSGVDADWVGRRVVADTPESGGYRERAVAPADRLAEVPEGLDVAEAAALLHDGRTALRLVEVTQPREGEWVLITGAAGGLGLLLIQLARLARARVVGAARGERKLALARDLGAEAAVDYTQPDWAAQVFELTAGTGPSVVFDGVGGEIGKAAFAVTAEGGRFSAHGAPGGGFAAIDPHDAERAAISLTGIDQVQLAPADARHLTEQALAEAAAGRIKPVIGQTFPLERAADAHRAIESRDVVGKTLLEV